MIERAFWFVQQNFIILISLVTLVALGLIAAGYSQYAEILPIAYFSLLALLIVFRTETGTVARVAFGGITLTCLLLAWVYVQ